MSSIFKAYDVRDKYPSEVNEDNALKTGRAFINLLNGHWI
jgi:phosphomannomutase